MVIGLANLFLLDLMEVYQPVLQGVLKLDLIIEVIDRYLVRLIHAQIYQAEAALPILVPAVRVVAFAIVTVLLLIRVVEHIIALLQGENVVAVILATVVVIIRIKVVAVIVTGVAIIRVVAHVPHIVAVEVPLVQQVVAVLGGDNEEVF